MKSTSIATYMKNKLVELDRNCIWYGDIQIIENCAAECGVKASHPRKTISAVLNALDNSPLFSKSYIIADINGSKRRYRCFSIIEKAED